MNQMHVALIVESHELLESLNRKAASFIKSDGNTCIHLMHFVGPTEEEGYEDQLKIAKSDSKVIPMPTKLDEPHFKEKSFLSQLSIKVRSELRKGEADLFDLLADKMGASNVLLSASSEWAKENGQHTFIELLAYYRNYVLAANPVNLKAIKDNAVIYDRTKSFEEIGATFLGHVAAMQPYDVTTQYQKLELLKTLINGMTAQQRAFDHYCQANPKFTKQTLEGAIKFIARELKNNSSDHIEQASSINNMAHEDMIELNNHLIQNQAIQGAQINQLTAAMNVNTATAAAIPRRPNPPRPTTKYCHLHGSNNTHNGTECKKMASPGFTMKGKAVTQAMINNGVPGAMVDGVAGRM